jgi:hypothetical protein
VFTNIVRNLLLAPILKFIHFQKERVDRKEISGATVRNYAKSIKLFACTKCTIEYWPKQQPVKKQSKFDLPGPPTDSHGNVIGDNDISIAVIDDPNKELSSTTYKQQKLSPSFEMLKKAGFKFTSYDER